VALLTPVFDARTESASTDPEASRSFSHTTAGDLRALLVFVSIRLGDTVSTLTYNSVALTRIGAQSSDATRRIEVWVLINPTIGANTVLVTPSASTEMAVTAISFNYVNQGGGSSSYRTPVTATDTSAAPSVTATSAVGELVVDGLAIAGGTVATVGAGQTQRANHETGGAGFNCLNAVSTEPGASSVVMAWSLSGSGSWSLAAVSLLPADVYVYAAPVRPLSFDAPLRPLNFEPRKH
jgi:hypothetical protein